MSTRTMVQPFIDLCHQFQTPNIGQIITFILTNFLPTLCQEIGQDQSLTGLQKKQLVITTINNALSQGCAILDQKFPQSGLWLNTITPLIETTLPALIDLLISVEKNQIVFNPTIKTKISTFFSCCTKKN